ncbi:MAG: hypothetical protein U1C60_03950 [Rhodocyclaceae bacterium]|nr:hypothetical protein [Rhodocyclaceae bacterium]
MAELFLVEKSALAGRHLPYKFPTRFAIEHRAVIGCALCGSAQTRNFYRYREFGGYWPCIKASRISAGCQNVGDPFPNLSPLSKTMGCRF